MNEGDTGFGDLVRIAAIDLGSNSFHLLVAEVTGPDSFQPVLQEKMMIQLGKRALITGRLDPQDIARGLRCLREFRRLLLSRRVEKTLAVATSAIRESENGDEFLRRAKKATGLHVRAISGREEARLIHLAVSRHVDMESERALLIDIGGGSAEVSVADAHKAYFTTSARLGFLRLQGRFVTRDPMSRREARTLRLFLRDSLAGTLATVRKRSPSQAVATSGSMISMLRLAQQRRKDRPGARVRAGQVGLGEIRRITRDMLALPAVERAARFDLDPLRAEYMPTALLTLEAILEGSGLNRVTITPVGLREGMVYDFLGSEGAVVPVPESPADARMRAVLDLAERCGYPVEHSHRVAFLASRIFRQTASLHGLGDEGARLLNYGAVLHDIGYHIAYTRHHKHGYYLVMNCDLRGISPVERLVLACLVRYHRRAAPRPSHAAFGSLPANDRRLVAALTAILRIADAMDLNHFSLVEEVEVHRTRRRLVFYLHVRNMARRAPLDIDAVQRHARYFEKLFGVETAFRIRRLRRGAAEGAPRGRTDGPANDILSEDAMSPGASPRPMGRSHE